MLLRRLLALAVATSLAFILPLHDAAASPGDLYGIMPRGIGTAGARTASSTDTGASWYNPANLAFAGQRGHASLELGYGFGLPSLFVDRTKAEGRFPTLAPERHGWIMAAGLFPLGGKLKNNTTLSFAIFHPDTKLVKVESLDPRKPQWYRYQANPDRPMITAGFGTVLWDRVALGASANVLANVDGNVAFGLDLFNRRVGQRDISFSLETHASAVVGATVKVIEGLKLGLVWRGDQSVKLKQPNAMDLGDIGNLTLDVSGTVHYSPHQLAFGAEYQVNDRLSLSADLLYSFWSLAPWPGLRTRVIFEGELAEAFGLDEVFSFETGDEKAGFANTLAPSLSGEYRLTDAGAMLRAGYAFRPTLVPDQVEVSNYLDAHTHVVAIGATVPFQDPLELFARPMHLDLGAQLHYVTPRQTSKRAGASNPVGDHRIGGTVIALAASLRCDY